ncbi:MAG: DUF5317 domain-containing protein [Chloroflexi bacterium]|nr:DUF5317 domain-containing protein [Chloroflexota bacterium]
MFFLLLLTASIVLALLRGGKFINLSRVRFRSPLLILLGLWIQIVIYSDFWQANLQLKPFAPHAYLLSLALLLIALARNLRLPGMRVILFGFTLNALVIALNGGYMPTTPEARAIAGQPILAPGETHNNSIGAGAETRLVFLSDIFAIPKTLPLPNVFSIGDSLIMLGVAYLIQKAMRQSSSPDD